MFKDKFGRKLQPNDYVIVYWSDCHPELLRIEEIINTTSVITSSDFKYYFKFYGDEFCIYNKKTMDFTLQYCVKGTSVERLPKYRKKREQLLIVKKMEGIVFYER